MLYHWVVLKGRRSSNHLIVVSKRILFFSSIYTLLFAYRMLYTLAHKLSCMLTGRKLNYSHLQEEVALDTSSIMHLLERQPEMPNHHFGYETFLEHRNKLADSILKPAMTPTIMADLTYLIFSKISRSIFIKTHKFSGLKI